MRAVQTLVQPAGVAAVPARRVFGVRAAPSAAGRWPSGHADGGQSGAAVLLFRLRTVRAELFRFRQAVDPQRNRQWRRCQQQQSAEQLHPRPHAAVVVGADRGVDVGARSAVLHAELSVVPQSRLLRRARC